MKKDLTAILAAIASEEEDEERWRLSGRIARTNVVSEPEPEPGDGLDAFQTDTFQNDTFQ
jgi:hypothetical protein